MTRREVDPEQIASFVDAIFRHASDGQIISLRTFDDCGGSKPLNIHAVEINGGGHKPVTEAAVMQAQWAADHSKKAVFCPPLAGFSSKTKADEAHLLEGYTLSVECDEYTKEAQQKLEALLGPATLVVASGGFWIDGATGEVQDKLHLHWRLNEPAAGDGLKLLKEARRLATALVGGDCSNVPIVHPMRWPGSWHRKREPRLARIVSKTESEIDLSVALELLREIDPEQPETKAESADRPHHGERQDKRSTAELITNITSGRQFHPSIVPLSARLIAGGMHHGAAVNFIRELMEEVPPEARDFRWRARFDDVPRMVESAEEKFGTKDEAEGAAIEIEPIDLWAKFDPPTLPAALLPPVIEEFARVQGEMMGADPGGLAVAALAVCATAIPDRIKLQVKRHDPNWQESARLWVALVGDPSTKKSPILSQAARPLVQIDAQLYREFCRRTAEYNARSRDEQRAGEPPKQTRLRIEDTTIEAAQEVLKDSPNGVLCLQDELSGWFGAMDKYAGNRGAAKDRGFWLQSFNGGPYAINRIGRGAGLIDNLSVSMLGGIQPEPVRKLAGDGIDDGLLQRLCPVVLKPASLGRDEVRPDVVGEYGALIQALVNLKPPAPALRFHDDAHELRRELECQHLKLLNSEFINRKLAAHIGKFDGLFARLCIVWHCVENVGTGALPKEITVVTARRVAAFLHKFLLRHAIAFYAGILGLSDDHDRLTAVAGYILAHQLEVVTNRDVQRGDRTMRGIERPAIQRIFEQLEALGWLQQIAGKRPSDPPHWKVNPAVHTRLATRGEQERKRRQEARQLVADLLQEAS